MDPFLIVAGAVVLLAVVLSAFALFASRRAIKQELASPDSIGITRAGFVFVVVQTLLTFALLGWGFFNPGGLLGRLVNHIGPVVFMAIVAIACYLVLVLLQRHGITLYYKRSGGG